LGGEGRGVADVLGQRDLGPPLAGEFADGSD
jgi:hypothetical protein